MTSPRSSHERSVSVSVGTHSGERGTEHSAVEEPTLSRRLKRARDAHGLNLNVVARPSIAVFYQRKTGEIKMKNVDFKFTIFTFVAAAAPLLAGLTASLTLSGCGHKNPEVPTRVAKGVDGSPSISETTGWYSIRVFKYAGHQYISFRKARGGNGWRSEAGAVVHDPDCPCRSNAGTANRFPIPVEKKKVER